MSVLSQQQKGEITARVSAKLRSIEPKSAVEVITTTEAVEALPKELRPYTHMLATKFLEAPFMVGVPNVAFEPSEALKEQVSGMRKAEQLRYARAEDFQLNVNKVLARCHTTHELVEALPFMQEFIAPVQAKPKEHVAEERVVISLWEELTRNAQEKSKA